MLQAYPGGATAIHAPSVFAHIRWDGTDVPTSRCRMRQRAAPQGYRASATGGGGGLAPVGSAGNIVCPGFSFTRVARSDDDPICEFMNVTPAPLS